MDTRSERISNDSSRTGTDFLSAEREHEGSSRPCEHGWVVESRHQTSLGAVLYVRCVLCRARRVDVQSDPRVPPSAVSVEVDVR